MRRAARYRPEGRGRLSPTAAGIAACVLALVVGACGLGDRAPADTAAHAADSTAAGDTFDIAAQPARKALPGTPDRSRAETDNYIEHVLKFNWTESPQYVLDTTFECPDPAACGGQNSIRLRIYPELLAVKANVRAKLQAGSDSGYFLAKIQNMNRQHPYGPFGMQADEAAYLWAGKSDSGPPRIRIVHWRKGENARMGKAATEAQFCEHTPLPKSAVKTVSPEPCTTWQSLYSQPAQGALSVPPASTSHLTRAAPATGVQGLLAIVQARGGFWVTCSSGCCEAHFQ